MEKLECPSCGGEMARAIRDLRYVYKGKPLVVPALDALVCAACGEIKPPVVLVKFFQVLDRHPELLAELR